MVVVVPSDYRAQRHGAPQGIFHMYGPLRVARHARGHSNAPPGWFVTVINEVAKDVERVAAFLDDVIAFGSDPSAHVKTIRAFFERLGNHNLKLSPSKGSVKRDGR